MHPVDILIILVYLTGTVYLGQPATGSLLAIVHDNARFKL